MFKIKVTKVKIAHSELTVARSLRVPGVKNVPNFRVIQTPLLSWTSDDLQAVKAIYNITHKVPPLSQLVLGVFIHDRGLIAMH